jgi:ATP-dependent DNA helicase RecQ
VNYIVDVLLGKNNERIKSAGHYKLTTFGIGKEFDALQWRTIFRQLVAQGFLIVDVSGYGSLKLSEACRPLLRAEQSIQFRQLSTESARKTSPKREVQRFEHQYQEELWQSLRKLRRQIAEEQGVPPYVIFHDATLMEMITYQPRTHEQMAAISGVGKRKLELYGDAFIEAIQQYAAQENKEDSSVETSNFY